MSYSSLTFSKQNQLLIHSGFWYCTHTCKVRYCQFVMYTITSRSHSLLDVFLQLMQSEGTLAASSNTVLVYRSLTRSSLLIYLGARGSIVGWGRKVAGSMPEEVVGFLNWPNPSSRTMALGSAQPLTGMSTRNFPGCKGRPTRGADNLTAICEPIV
jgi:hypothetical protein